VINKVMDDLFCNGVKTHILRFGYMHSEPVTFGHQNWHSNPRTGEKLASFTEITFSEFLEFVVVPNESKMTYAKAFMYDHKNRATKPQERGLRYNNGKPTWSLVDFDSLEGMVRVLEYGAGKYAPHNWKKGMPHTEIADCLLRHLFAWIHGEDTDQESGQKHLDHVLCNAMFLAYNTKHHPDLDNRYKTPKK